MHTRKVGLGILVVLVCALIAQRPQAEGLFAAIAAGDTKRTLDLLSEPEQHGQLSPAGETPLIYAIVQNEPLVAAALLDHGSKPGERSAKGFTPLHAAAYVGQFSLVEKLIERDADVNDQDNTAAATPLILAAEEGHLTVVETLIAEGSDVERAERNGYTALTKALWRGHTKVMVALKRGGAICQPVEILEQPAFDNCQALKF